MQKIHKHRIFTILAISLLLSVMSLVPLAHAAGPTTVNLGTAEPFAILSGAGVTNVPTSVITGNVGVSPATGASITGLTCAEVTGVIYTVNAAGPACRVVDGPLMVTAKNDLTAAYLDAAGRTPETSVPTELGGTTKTAGVYSSASTTFGITAGAGPLVLDGQGDPSSVFIFDMNSSGTGLTVGPGSTVSLINGAQACNVFWRVDTATIDTTAVFKGTILALTSITVANGANIEGRLLAQNGSVTLNSDTITRPVCAPPSTTTPPETPGLPDTGVDPSNHRIAGLLTILVLAIATAAVLSLYLVRRKRTN